ncbi:MAG: RuBisCO large subunit C-terminal-like domain-containing protein [Rhodopseudomonas palustris]|nr:RuBisCO large subunit C-terminal-like domain-containing protein [Rhodopseudomonas palustris]
MPAYQFWLGGDFIKNDEPQGNQVFCADQEGRCRWSYDAMKRAMDETGQAKLFSANITADDHYEMLRARRLHPGDLRPGRRQGRLPGGRLRRRPRHGHHRAPSVPRTSTCTTTAPATAR